MSFKFKKGPCRVDHRGVTFLVTNFSYKLGISLRSMLCCWYIENIAYNNVQTTMLMHHLYIDLRCIIII